MAGLQHSSCLTYELEARLKSPAVPQTRDESIVIEITKAKRAKPVAHNPPSAFVTIYWGIEPPRAQVQRYATLLIALFNLEVFRLTHTTSHSLRRTDTFNAYIEVESTPKLRLAKIFQESETEPITQKQPQGL